MILEQYQREIEADKEAARTSSCTRCGRACPTHQQVLDMMEDRKEKAKRIADMEVKLAEFKILSESLTRQRFRDRAG